MKYTSIHTHKISDTNNPDEPDRVGGNKIVLEDLRWLVAQCSSFDRFTKVIIRESVDGNSITVTEEIG